MSLVWEFSNPEEFEKFCRDLWSEILQVEVTLHGRSGQGQDGADAYLSAAEGDQWIGIECKVRQRQLGSQLTEKDVEEIVHKAKKFDPPLSKLIVATTSSRDTKVQKLERHLRSKYRNAGLFELQIVWWEDIERHLESRPHLIEKYLRRDGLPGYGASSSERLLRDFERRGQPLVRALERLPAWQDSSRIEPLAEDLGVELQEGASRAFDLLRACIALDRLEALVDVFGDAGGGSEHLQELFRQLDAIDPRVITWEEHSGARSLLSSVRLPVRLARHRFHRVLPTTSAPYGDAEEVRLHRYIKILTRKFFSSGSEPLLEFLEACSYDLDSDEVRNRLAEWIEQVSRRLGVDLEALRARVRKWASELPDNDHSALMMIAVHPHEEEGKASVEAWLSQTGSTDHLSPLSDGTPDLAEAASKGCRLEELEKALERVNRWGHRGLGRHDRMIVHVFLPVDRIFDIDPHEWRIRIGKRRASTWGCRCILVVRSYERAFDRLTYGTVDQDWRRKWKQRPPRVTPQDVCWWDELGGAGERSSQRLRGAGSIVASDRVSAHQPMTIEEFEDLLDYGFPIALWTRGLSAPEDDVRRKLESVLTEDMLDRLPRRLFEKRSGSGDDEDPFANRVTLLWDDPDCFPPGVADFAHQAQAPKE